MLFLLFFFTPPVAVPPPAPAVTAGEEQLWSMGLFINITLGSTLRNTARTQLGMVWVIGVR